MAVATIPTKKGPLTGLCYGCHRTVKVRCPHCKRCLKCGCTCQYCTYCNCTHTHLVECPNCGRCKKSCKCGGKPGYTASVVTPDKVLGRHTVLNPFKRATSLEIELTYFGNTNISGKRYKYINKVYTEHDGSVNGSGQEMIIHGLAGDNVVLGLVEVASAMEEEGCKVDNSCGYHVHIDARDWGPLQLYNLIALWELFGKNIGYPYLFPTRIANRNCRTMYELKTWYEELKTIRDKAVNSNQFKAALQYSMWGHLKPNRSDYTISQNYVDDSKQYKDRLYRAMSAKRGVANRNYNDLNTRYLDLNLHSWFHRGTVEFRSHHGTLDPVELIGWALTCLQLMDIAGHIPYTAIEKMSIKELYNLFTPAIKQYMAIKGVEKGLKDKGELI